MSAEDLGMRELGQVRSQRLDEVSFLFLLFCHFHCDHCFPFPISYSLVTLEKDGIHCI